MPVSRRGRSHSSSRGGNSRNNYNDRRCQSVQRPDNRNPPEHYSELCVIPTVDDLMTANKPFLRRNLTKGSYMNVDHYLDVQFRLLREDFVQPLRDGIRDHVNSFENDSDDKKGNKNESGKKEVKIFNGITFGNVELERGVLMVRIEFNPRQVSNPDNAFKHGSLLCLSRDNFENIIIATVANSFPKGIEKGYINIKLENVEDFLELPYNDTYVMVEPDGFFSPYNHVLKALQSMNLGAYPMCDYVLGKRTTTQTPEHFRSSTRYARYSIDDHVVSLFDDSSWPLPNDLGLNEMQLRAFKMALRTDLALIQGPPGTGKTHLGIKMAKTLIENLDDGEPPVLVVCATNHALDQFLEHLTTVTSSLVRCGSQSQSTVLEPYMLAKLRGQKRYRALNRNVKKLSDECEKQMNILVQNIKRTLKDIAKIVNRRAVISVTSFSKITGLPTLEKFRKSRLTDKTLLTWLGNGKVRNAVDLTQLDVTCGESGLSFLIDLDNIEYTIRKNIKEVEVLKKQIVQNKHGGNSRKIAADMMEKLLRENEMLAERKKGFQSLLEMEVEELLINDMASQLGNAWNLPTVQRWRLYHCWSDLVTTSLEESLQVTIRQFEEVSLEYQGCSMERDLNVLRKNKIVGMTTSCSARLRPLLDNLKPRIMIVEEAAEVLEGHVVASLTRHCQHVILIGDHQQLRPVTSYGLASYNLDVSLFERLINNGVPCVTLQEQHRMRPEIASLVSPAIYPRLFNSKAVMGREDVVGVVSNVFFVNHNERDERTQGMSYRNQHEAALLVALCRYLLQNYAPETITVIAMYAAQVALIESQRDACEDARLSQIRVSTVDGYQGEENDIILLSLVRSNEHRNAGFLKTPNRVCVALSRAKIGLYIVGDMDCLTKERRSIWCAINDVLKRRKSIGSFLKLRCRTHENLVTVTSAADFIFDKVETTGCPLMCPDVKPRKKTVSVITQEFFNNKYSSQREASQQPQVNKLDFVERRKLLKAMKLDEKIVDLSSAFLRDREATQASEKLLKEAQCNDSNSSRVATVSPVVRQNSPLTSPSHNNFNDDFAKKKILNSVEYIDCKTGIREPVKDRGTATVTANSRQTSQHIFSPDYGHSSASRGAVQSSSWSSSRAAETAINALAWQSAVKSNPAPVPSHHLGAIPKSTPTAYSFSYADQRRPEAREVPGFAVRHETVSAGNMRVGSTVPREVSPSEGSIGTPLGTSHGVPQPPPRMAGTAGERKKEEKKCVIL